MFLGNEYIMLSETKILTKKIKDQNVQIRVCRLHVRWINRYIDNDLFEGPVSVAFEKDFSGIETYVLIKQLNQVLVSRYGNEKLGELSLKNNQDIFHDVLENNLEFINDLSKYANYVVKLSDEISSLLIYRNSGLIPPEPYTHHALEFNICILTQPLFSYTHRNTFGDPYGHIHNTRVIAFAV
jgi:hypothetical protein